MKRFAVFLVVAAIGAAIVATLMNNKAISESKLENNVIQTVFPVVVYTVQEENFPTNLTLIGTVAPKNDVNVVSETQGRIVATNIQVGDRVSAGTVLFSVDDELKKAQLIQAEANFEKSKKDYDRMTALFREKAVPESQLDGAALSYKLTEAQLITAKRHLRDTKITSPISGVVAARFADVGSNVGSNTAVANIVDMSIMKIKAMVSENDVFNLRVGDAAVVTADVYPGKKYSGKILSIGAKADEAHTYPVEILLSDPRDFKAGMFARVNFTGIQQSGMTLAAPREAIVGSVRDAKVFVAENGKARLKKVLCGTERNGKVQILSGLSAGERLIVTGQNNVSDGYRIKITEQ